ncbi:MAG: hypothetical protein D6790_07490, partial [Caldilineae bacterium]
DKVERAHLHETVGRLLEELYEDRRQEIAVSLARHFEEAHILDKAIEYLRRAGERAMRLSAHEEAIQHFTRALHLLASLPDTPERARQELTLQILLGNVLLATKGYTAPEVGQCYTRAQVLYQQIGGASELFPVLHGLHRYHIARAEFLTSLNLAQQCLDLARGQSDPALLVAAHRMMGTSLYFLGEFTTALDHYEQGMALYEPGQHASYMLLSGQDEGVGCRGYATWALWVLGYPDQSLERSREAVALARKLSHPYSLAYALVLTAWVHQFRREPLVVEKLAEEDVAISAKHGFAFWLAFGILLRGWALVEQGRIETGLDQMRQGLDMAEAMGVGSGRPYCLGMLAQAYVKMGRIQEALTLLDKAIQLAEETGEACSLSDLCYLKGECLLALSDANQTAAEACFRRAIDIARQQPHRISELRAAKDLSRLLWRQGKGEEARQLLAPVYGWFSEGFDALDLKEAKALLDMLPAAGSTLG